MLDRFSPHPPSCLSLPLYLSPLCPISLVRDCIDAVYSFVLQLVQRMCLRCFSCLFQAQAHHRVQLTTDCARTHSCICVAARAGFSRQPAMHIGGRHPQALATLTTTAPSTAASRKQTGSRGASGTLWDGCAHAVVARGCSDAAGASLTTPPPSDWAHSPILALVAASRMHRGGGFQLAVLIATYPRRVSRGSTDRISPCWMVVPPCPTILAFQHREGVDLGQGYAPPA